MSGIYYYSTFYFNKFLLTYQDNIVINNTVLIFNIIFGAFKIIYIGGTYLYYSLTYFWSPLIYVIYYSVYGPLIIVTKIYYFTKTLFLTSVIFGILYFVNKCYVIWDTIAMQSATMVHLIPDMPSLFYKMNNCILYGIVIPMQDIAASVNGSKILFIWEMIPKEEDILLMSYNLMELSTNILQEQCASQIIELSSFHNSILKFASRIVLAPAFFYFKLSGGFCGLAASWLSKWL